MLQNQGHNLKDVTEVKSEKIECINWMNCSQERPREYGICNRKATTYMLASELGDCKCTTDNPDSLVLKLAYGDRTALFVGDIEGRAIGTIANPLCNIKSDVLHLSHHGSVKNHTKNITCQLCQLSQNCKASNCFLKQQSLPLNMEPSQLPHCYVVHDGKPSYMTTPPLHVLLA